MCMWVFLNDFWSNTYIQYMEVLTQLHKHHNVSANNLHNMHGGGQAHLIFFL